MTIRGNRCSAPRSHSRRCRSQKSRTDPAAGRGSVVRGVKALDRTQLTPKPLHCPVHKKLDRGCALAHLPPDVAHGKVRAEFEPHRLSLLGRQPIDRRPDSAAVITPHNRVENALCPGSQICDSLEVELSLTAAVVTHDCIASNPVEP